MLTAKSWQRIAVVLAISLTSLVAASTAGASVAYIDGNEVWVSSDDGSRKVRLSGGENDWREVAQSDQGYIVGTRKEAGKISQLASFTVWNPSGQVVRFGSLSGHIDGDGLNVYPLSLDITPDGGLIVYGYSRSYNFGASLVNGIYVKTSADATTAVPLSITSGKYPTLVGTRIVAALSDSDVGLQDPGSIGSTTFNPWITAAIPSYFVGRTDVSATGSIAAIEMQEDATFKTGKVVMSKWNGLGGTYVDDCFLPAPGATNVSVSQDGGSVAWGDAGGVKLAGTPSFNGAADCALTRPPVTLSTTGIYPSYGPFNVAAALPANPPVPIVSAPASSKLSKALKSGITVTVTSPTGGKAAVTLTVKPKQVGKRGKKLIVIAKGSATLTAGAAKKIKLKFTKTGKKLKKKLKGDKATLTVKVGGATTTKSIKLK